MKRALKPVMRRIKRHFGASAGRVAVKSQRPWYWRLLIALLFILLGYGICYWQLTKGGFGNNVETVVQQNQSLLAKVTQSELLLQFEHAAQATLAKELASMQEEDMRLKQDLAFYKNILDKPTGPTELKLDSFKVSKTTQLNRYEYHIVLMQTGKPSKFVKGRINLSLIATQAGKTVTLPLSNDTSATEPIQINFKYYQRVDGSFSVPDGTTGQTVVASFTETGKSQPRLIQKADLPG